LLEIALHVAREFSQLGSVGCDGCACLGLVHHSQSLKFSSGVILCSLSSTWEVSSLINQFREIMIKQVLQGSCILSEVLQGSICILLVTPTVASDIKVGLSVSDLYLEILRVSL